MNEEEKKTIEKFIEKCYKYDESVEIKGISVGEEYRMLNTVCKALNLIEKLQEENEELKAEMKDGVIGIKLYALQTENEKLKKKIDLMENYMVENGWEICFDNIYAELNNCNGMERDWCRGDKLEKQDIHKYFSKKLLESEG